MKSPIAPATAPTTTTAPATAPTTALTAAPTGAASGAAVSYTPLVGKVELDIPPSLYATTAYQVELSSGKLSPAASTPKWGLALTHSSPTGSATADAFTGAGFDLSDFAVLTDPAATPAQCDTAIDTHPESVPAFAHASAGHLLCVRDRATHTIALADIEDANAQTGEVKLSLTTWQATT
ncbi:hypothetical protein [Kitasatospora sp. MAP5-34]|uniref:hypothetical protein n=1 Tax=Kitasatospora sp. MAP5-34 TaxID=3035102 RepID=UPI00247505E9|nr:hypothetical protein [Kitasatospora sp. MAP5-34]MDH6577323.1 hypothetical protein [Kitasatospora sp. MAP5-34]